MKLGDAIVLVAGKFKYTPDIESHFDVWRVMSLDHGVFRGDCEDFSLTVIWHCCDCNLLKFLWKAFVTHEYKLHQVYDFKGNKHVVGSHGDLWFDNWTLAALPKDEFFKSTRHDYIRTYFLPSMVLSFITGLIKNG